MKILSYRVFKRTDDVLVVEQYRGKEAGMDWFEPVATVDGGFPQAEEWARSICNQLNRERILLYGCDEAPMICPRHGKDA